MTTLYVNNYSLATTTDPEEALYWLSTEGQFAQVSQHQGHGRRITTEWHGHDGDYNKGIGPRAWTCPLAALDRPYNSQDVSYNPDAGTLEIRDEHVVSTAATDATDSLSGEFSKWEFTLESGAFGLIVTGFDKAWEQVVMQANDRRVWIRRRRREIETKFRGTHWSDR